MGVLQTSAPAPRGSRNGGKARLRGQDTRGDQSLRLRRAEEAAQIILDVAQGMRPLAD
jgi:hypothetical protein